MNPSTNHIAVSPPSGESITTHRVETADTWYDEETDQLFFVQLATGKVYACHVDTIRLRLVADTGVKAENASSYAVVYLPDSRHCLIVYDHLVAGDLPWKLVNLVTGKIRHLNMFAVGCDHHNTGAYHPPTKTIVITGGSGESNWGNGTAFHHYRLQS